MTQTPHPLTLSQLERHLYAATDILRSKVDPRSYQGYFFGLLFLKRCWDVFEERCGHLLVDDGSPSLDAQDTHDRALYTETLYVPPESRWPSLCASATEEGNAARLDRALAALERENPALSGALAHIRFSPGPGGARLSEQTLRDLLRHFSRYRLRDADLEFPDLLGAAYEYLLADFADSAGRRGGEFYTPRDVLDVMVRILQPTAGMSIYDPCAGSGGALMLALQYVTDGRTAPRDLRLYGQESNGSAWALCKMNALLHGCPWADIRQGDTLADPLHVVDGRLMRFDRVISNPPYSQNYTRSGMAFPERFRYGFCPETGRRGDLMFVQHILSVLASGGMAAAVAPHGVLFRSGAEREIRRGLVEDDVLEAVIGLPSNLFYGTSIPTCLLVLRPSGGKPDQRRGQVLFINADADYEARRGQNRLGPEHRERIVSTFLAWRAVPGYAAVVERSVLADNDFNLSIRRYADNTPPPEPHDVRAHLLGGIPRSEVEDLAPQLAALGAHPGVFFRPRQPDDGYLDFQPGLVERGQIRALIASHAGMRARQAQLICACQQWWKAAGDQLLPLLQDQALLGARAELLRSFTETLSPVGLLDGDVLRGTFAAWWEGRRYDLKTLAAQGCEALLARWVESQEPTAQRAGSLTGTSGLPDQQLLDRLLPGAVEDLAVVSRAIADLECRLSEATRSDEEEGEDADEPQEGSAQEAQAIRRELAAHRRAAQARQGEIFTHLQAASRELSPAACRQVVLDLLLDDLLARLERRAAGQRDRLSASVEHLWEKYRVSLREIEADCQRAQQRLNALLKELGYADD